MSEAAARPLPRADGHWLFGSAFDLAAAPHRFAAEAPAHHGGIVRFRVLHKPFVAICDAEHIRQVLVTHQQRYTRSFHYENPVVGKGLLSIDGPVWLKRRRQVQPAFRRDTLRHLVQVANDTTGQLLQRWEGQSRAGEPVEVVAEMQQLALSVIGHALLSTDLGRDRAARFATAVRAALRLLRQRNTSLLRLPHWVPTSLNRRLAATRKDLDDFICPIIAARRADGGRHSDILAALLDVRDPESGDALDDQAVLDETKTLFTAGFETTATAMSWTLYLLARHPEVAVRWQEEVDGVLAGREPTWEDLQQLTYTAQLLNESLRLYPPVYNMARQCVEEDVVGGYGVPRGTVVLLSVLGVHHDPRWWPEPHAFRPERFAGDWPRHAYLPFGGGKHLCVGNNFSLTEMAVALARIAQRYRLEPVNPAPVAASAQITLVPARPIRLRLVPRA
jgi:cytochrome P450